MASTSPTDERAPGASSVDTTDWPAQAADTIERVVQGVRDKTTGPAINAARWVVAGMFIAVIGVALGVLVVVGLIRLIDVYLPESVFGDSHVWAAYTIVGLIFSIVGLVLLSRRSRRPTV
jgi:hypothetical protein